MALVESLRIIWLDAYIGQDNECHSFKRMFCTTLDPDARCGDPLDTIICALNENAAPFIFVDTMEKAIKEIEFYQDKQIIFISSGSLGERIVPVISSKYRHVYSFYIFCAITANYLDLVLDYDSCLQIFTSELDLLVRLVRDISLEIINKGRYHLDIDDPKTALTFFEHSQKLEKTANEKDKANGAFHKHLRLLEGYEDDIGLIKKALILIEEQKGDIQEEQGPIMSERDSCGESQEPVQQNPPSPLSQQEKAHEYPDSPLARQ
jgi:tetratricopeptide (TPR) repeat protein